MPVDAPKNCNNLDQIPKNHLLTKWLLLTIHQVYFFKIHSRFNDTTTENWIGGVPLNLMLWLAEWVRSEISLMKMINWTTVRTIKTDSSRKIIRDSIWTNQKLSFFRLEKKSNNFSETVDEFSFHRHDYRAHLSSPL